MPNCPDATIIMPMKTSRNYGAQHLELLQPETPLEWRLLQDETFCEGLNWGRPRFGHPEGKVYRHIREVLDNIDALGVRGCTRERLRLIAFSHDTFKYREVRGFPRDWARHHGMLARRYMEAWTNDQAVLDILELHDEAFYAWRCIFVYRMPQKGKQRLQRLLHRVKECLQLYYLFFKCDTETGDKKQAPLNWFEQAVPNIDRLPPLR